MTVNLKQLITPGIATIIILANFFIFKNWLIGLLVGLWLLWITGKTLGSWFFPKLEQKLRHNLGMLLVIFLASLPYFVLYYVWQVPNWTFVLSALILLALNLLPNHEKDFSFPKFKFSSLGLLYVLLMVGYFVCLCFFQTTNAIYTPWSFLPFITIPLFILATVVLFFFLKKNKQGEYSWWLNVHFFGLVGLAFIIYKLGFGYDPFLHLAGMKNILLTGTLMPKPFYYIGGYSIILFIQQLTQLPLELLNRILTPLAFSWLIPLVGSFSLKKIIPTRLSGLALLFLPIISLSMFISTTPQSFTNILVLLVVFLSLIPKEELPKSRLLPFSIMTTFIHPLYGVPLFLFNLYLIVKESNFKFKSIIQPIILLCSVIAIPAQFVVLNILNHGYVSLGFFGQRILNSFVIFNKQYNFIFDLIYTFSSIILLVIIAIVVNGWLIDRRKNPGLIFALLNFVAFVVCVLFLQLNLADKNQMDFYFRILELAIYFALPTIFVFIGEILNNQQRAYRTFSVLLLIIVTGSGLYLTYPVKDNYRFSHNINVSKADFDTAKWIENNANSTYVVLANQNLAAAAISQFGFKYYYNDEYYYSTPGQGQLYNLFEKMIGDPQSRVIDEVKSKYHVSTVYFVVPSYWTDAVRRIEKTKLLTDKWQEIPAKGGSASGGNHGKEVVFEF